MKTIYKHCPDCDRRLYVDSKGSKRHYKFCPDCGAESDETLPVKHHSVRPYKMGIMVVPWLFMLFQAHMFLHSLQPGETGHNIMEFVMLVAFPLTVILYIFLSSSFCPHCLDFNRRKFKYCPNCGQQK